MIDSVVNAFNTLKLENAQKMSQLFNGINDENIFLDDNYIASEIKHLQSTIDIIKKTSIDESDKIKTIADLSNQSAILAANNIRMLETAKSVLHTTRFKFEICVDAMIAETHEQHQVALSLFDTFWKSGDYTYNNYLAPKMYACLLLNHTNRTLSAINCLSIALQLRPNDIQIRKLFRDALIQAGEATNAEIQNTIIKILTDEA